ncbi:MAG: biotin/lipoyl-binding protein [Candidatus Limnocylindrales bacterium]
MTDETAGRAPTGSVAAGGDGLAALTEDVLPALIARLRASRLGELEVRTGDWRVRLRLDPATIARALPAGTPSAGEAPAQLDGSAARSTAVGYFTPSPDLVVGRSVRAGDVLGAIDVLGIAQEVVAATDGLVASVLAEEGQAVEYGQVLAQIDPLELDLAAADGEDRA